MYQYGGADNTNDDGGFINEIAEDSENILILELLLSW